MSGFNDIWIIFLCDFFVFLYLAVQYPTDLQFLPRELIEELHPIIKEALERRPEVLRILKIV